MSEIPNSNSIVSTIELKHVMNTYTTYQPTSNNVANTFMGGNNNPITTPSNPMYDHSNVNYYSMLYNMPTSTVQYRPSLVPNLVRPEIEYQQNQLQSQPHYKPPAQVLPQYQPQPQPVYPPMPAIPFLPTTLLTQPTYETKTPAPTQKTTTPASIQSAGNDIKQICGTRYAESEVIPLVFGGEETKRGDWPWMVAIYLNKPTGLSFNCGGSLISSKVVISAAHCINTSTKNYKPNEVLLWLGRYSLIDWSEVGAISSNVEEIIIHVDYKRQRESYDADIALLVMNKQVEFNQYVRPVCLWSGPPNIHEVEGKKGTVVGWGKDGTDRIVSNIPKRIDLPIVNSITCVQTSESLYKAVSNRTFCAGTLNGDGPCHGDSGKYFDIYHHSQ